MCNNKNQQHTLHDHDDDDGDGLKVKSQFTGRLDRGPVQRGFAFMLQKRARVHLVVHADRNA